MRGKNRDPGGGKLILPLLPQVRHVCVAQGPQRLSPHDGFLMQKGGKEAATPGVGGGAGRDIDGNNFIWDPPLLGKLLQLPWESPLGGGQKTGQS